MADQGQKRWRRRTMGTGNVKTLTLGRLLSLVVPVFIFQLSVAHCSLALRCISLLQHRQALA
jgi:hypothetical protein